MGILSWLKRRRRGSTLQKPLRLWPGVAAAVLLLLLRFGLPLVWGEAALVSIVGGLACAVLILVWWVFFSRAPWIERIGALVVIVAAVFAVWPFLDKSIATAMMGRLVYVYALPPVVAPALVAWAVATRHLSNGLRRATMVLTIFLACGFWTLFRTEGIKGGSSQVTWRWTRTAEERLLAATEKPAAVAPAPAPAVAPPTSKPAEWPGFRGKDRDSVIHGVRIETDWSASPPVQIWRRPIGPGWSSFAVQGDRLYTQEQRGDDELVSSYRVSTGEPVWRHRDTVRFWESNGGAGPRGTPTLSNGRVFTFGATGILNALDAGNGAVAWSRNLVSETGAKIPMYGFAGSPLVLDDLVIVAVSGRLAAFDAATGTKRWVVASSGGSYSSPHLATLDGVPQIVLLNAGGAKSVMPADGTVLWEVAWPGDVTIV